MYIYIYTHTYIHIYIVHIYIYIYGIIYRATHCEETIAMPSSEDCARR